MQISATQLAQMLQGTLEGDAAVQVSRPAPIEGAESGTITFLANMKYEPHLYTTGASIVLVPLDLELRKPISATLIRVENVYASVAFLMERFGATPKPEGEVSPQAQVHPEAVLEEGVYVGPFSVVGRGARIGANTVLHAQVYVGENVEIGSDSELFPGVRIYKDCKVGKRCTLHANAVIGSDGFGFAPQADGSYKKIAQLGNVVIEDEVEIGAQTVIDRATMGSTILRRGVKLDNLIQVAHNVEIGEHTVIAAQTGIAGSTRIGKGVQVGGQVGFVGHIHIADGVKVQAQSGVNRSINEAGSAVYGSPALGYQEFLKAYSVFRKLPEILKRLLALEKANKPPGN